MTSQPDNCLPVASWFLYTEADEPLGRIYRSGDEMLPSLGDRLEGADRWGTAEVIAFEELRPTCAMRRFKVVVRILS
ncbi:MAG: hypothetical protein IH861_04065 [Chloroflexi bacterium]|nr:hypothetical protein [Chloroflexota bacterium]